MSNIKYAGDAILSGFMAGVAQEKSFAEAINAARAQRANMAAQYAGVVQRDTALQQAQTAQKALETNRSAILAQQAAAQASADAYNNGRLGLARNADTRAQAAQNSMENARFGRDALLTAVPQDFTPAQKFVWAQDQMYKGKATPEAVALFAAMLDTGGRTANNIATNQYLSATRSATEQPGLEAARARANMEALTMGVNVLRAKKAAGVSLTAEEDSRLTAGQQYLDAQMRHAMNFGLPTAPQPGLPPTLPDFTPVFDPNLNASGAGRATALAPIYGVSAPPPGALWTDVEQERINAARAGAYYSNPPKRRPADQWIGASPGVNE